MHACVLQVPGLVGLGWVGSGGWSILGRMHGGSDQCLPYRAYHGTPNLNFRLSFPSLSSSYHSCVRRVCVHHAARTLWGAFKGLGFMPRNPSGKLPATCQDHPFPLIVAKQAWLVAASSFWHLQHHCCVTVVCLGQEAHRAMTTVLPFRTEASHQIGMHLRKTSLRMFEIRSPCHT